MVIIQILVGGKVDIILHLQSRLIHLYNVSSRLQYDFILTAGFRFGELTTLRQYLISTIFVFYFSVRRPL